MGMPAAKLLMTFGSQVGATQTNLDLKSVLMSFFFQKKKKRFWEKNKILSRRNVWLLTIVPVNALS